MFKTRSKKIEEILFGKCNKLKGGLNVLSNFSYPQKNSIPKILEWDGNMGLIFELFQRIENLENKQTKSNPFNH